MLVVLGVSAMMALMLSMLWSSTNLETQIAGNKYRISQARLAAQSGISHFIALDIPPEEVFENIVIPETRLSQKTSYKVEAVQLDDDKILVISTGIYKKAGRDLFEYPMRAIFHPY